MRKLKTIEMGRLTVEQFKAAGKLPLVVVLDNVRSLYNVGSVFRSCDAFRIERICLCGITACPPHAEIHKTALGAEDSVQWQYFATATAAVEQLHREGYTVMAVEQCEGSTMLHHFVPDTGRRYAVVLGNEVRGPRGGQHGRRLSRDTTVWHQAQSQRERHGRHRGLALCHTRPAHLCRRQQYSNRQHQ